MTKVLTHTGAWNADAELRGIEQSAAESAAQHGSTASTALDAACMAVEQMEDHPSLDAGLGSVVQLDGRIRMDAAVADSSGRYAGIVQIEHIKNPSAVARRLMDYGWHKLLSGEGALQFALEEGFLQESVYTTATMKEFMDCRSKVPQLQYKALAAQADEFRIKKMSTVGAVARDSFGALAAVNSTGGLTFGYPGRVGDTALFGNGIYCDENVAVACTGDGEAIISTLLARRVAEFYATASSLQEAVDAAIEVLALRGVGGVIAIDKNGQTGVGYNTDFMGNAVVGV